MSGRGRRGFGLVGVLLIVLCLAGVGLAIAYLAQHADRAGRWFCHAQVAYDLADAALREALFLLTEKNGRAAAGGDGAWAQVLDELMRGRSGGRVPLMTSADARTMPAALAAQLEAYAGDLAPTLDVTLEVLANEPFWDGLREGLPLQDGERTGTVRLTARASVKAPAGVLVERTLTMEKGFRVVSLLPPLVGRFSLFVDPDRAMDPNVFRARFDENTGDTQAEAGSALVVLRSRTAAPLVARGSNRLDRAGFVAALEDPRFLERQGWVYLGPQPGPRASWVLKLTHGYGAAGETPLLPGVRAHVLFRGSQGEDDAFRQRFDDAFRANATPGCQSDLVHPTERLEGLEHFVHGWASNYELIGMGADTYAQVQGRARMNFGPGESSCLRLFGTPEQTSPTLVFGPVVASVLRNASVEVQVGPPEFCPTSGRFRLQFFRIPEHDARVQNLLRAAFAGDYDAWGTNVIEDLPYMQLLETALSASGGGAYAPDGLLDRIPDGGGSRAPAVPSREELERMFAGRLDQPAVYSGNLALGLSAFVGALRAKTTFTVRAEAFERRLLGGAGGRELSVPGIVRLREGGDGAQALVLPAGLTVKRGGILIAPGPIRIEGDIRRAAASEPLTLVSLAGDITLGPGARVVDAYLVAAGGRVEVQGGGATVNGGVACRALEFAQLAQLGTPLTLAHAAETDPAGPFREGSLRAYYGGADRVVAGGSGP